MTRTTLTALALILGTTALSAEEISTGLTALTIPDASRPLSGVILYPTHATETVRGLGNAVWEPIRIAPDAPPIVGKYPLVVLSHGMFGNHRNQAWLAEGLVAQGYIVAAIDHPGTSTFLRDPDDQRMLWERPRDISRVIDHLGTDAAFAELIDPDRIFMAGHSLGGFTAVALAGGRFDADGWDDYCTRDRDDLVCGIFDRWSVAKTPEDRDAMGQDLSDPRISGFAVLDLGGTQTFSAESLGAIDRPMLVFGAPNDINGLDLDVESRALVAALDEGVVTYHEPAGLAHFDFLGQCTQTGEAILLDEEPQDAFVCKDATTQRAQEHAILIREIIDFFENI